jgi:hypothetical protein
MERAHRDVSPMRSYCRAVRASNAGVVLQLRITAAWRLAG